jgi:hypothetical protein
MSNHLASYRFGSGGRRGPSELRIGEHAVTIVCPSVLHEDVALPVDDVSFVGRETDVAAEPRVDVRDVTHSRADRRLVLLFDRPVPIRPRRKLAPIGFQSPAGLGQRPTRPWSRRLLVDGLGLDLEDIPGAIAELRAVGIRPASELPQRLAIDGHTGVPASAWLRIGLWAATIVWVVLATIGETSASGFQIEHLALLLPAAASLWSGARRRSETARRVPAQPVPRAEMTCQTPVPSCCLHPTRVDLGFMGDIVWAFEVGDVGPDDLLSALDVLDDMLGSTYPAAEHVALSQRRLTLDAACGP